VSSTRRQFLGAGLATSALVSAAIGMLRASPAHAAKASPIATSSLGGDFSLITGAGCNVVALKGEQGSLLVDGGSARHSKALLTAAAGVTGNRRVATLINTHWHPAQTGSNEAVGRAGGEIVAHEVTKLYLARSVASVDYEGLYGPLLPEGRPTKTTRIAAWLLFSGRHVDYGYLPAAHTNGDLYVHFPEANLLVAGGPVASESWPLLDWRNGAWLGGLVRAHEKLVRLVKPDTRVIPANGRALTGAELQRHHEMLAAFHEKMVVFQNRGMDTGDCIAARPLKDHEARLGDATEFIRGAFHSLNLAYSPD
jgi:glyoxylase-like metal-dependent hydrolase (beta-lactamase superfamily II)